MKSKLHNDERFRFVTYFATDLKETFRREIARLKAEQKKAASNTKEVSQKVRPLPRVKSA